VPSAAANEPRGTNYAFANTRAVQRERLALLAALLDEGSFRLLGRLGVGPGWRCVEVGAGGGSVAAWLCERVAPDGTVLATDLDRTVLRGLQHPNLEVHVHDVLTDELPQQHFDLVHARLLLAWLTDPERALRRMVAGLKPGGWLLAEEMDFDTIASDSQLDPEARALFGRVLDAHHKVLAERHAFDPFYGRGLDCALSVAGLANVQSEGRIGIWQGGHPGGTVWRLTLIQLRDELISHGSVTADEVDQVVELCTDSRLRFISQATIAAWGQRLTGQRRDDVEIAGARA
jgi:SAM-dependent methyltransferase